MRNPKISGYWWTWNKINMQFIKNFIYDKNQIRYIKSYPIWTDSV